MKIIAFYLPQFHNIPENDEWWGDGFTEWVNVKAAQPLFEGHNQPRIPLNEKYYNLLDDNVKIWQAELAKKYGVYGFCYYHYWFGGHMLLEKPMEQMLKNKEIDLPFCVCWANEAWTKAWVGDERKVLIPQVYGDKDDWKAHFDYLLPFFKDDRYIKENGKPLLVIYRPEVITDLNEMLDYWSELAKENGFPGLYYAYQAIGMDLDENKDDSRFDMDIEFQPSYARMKMHRDNQAEKGVFYQKLVKIKNNFNVFIEKHFGIDIKRIFDYKKREQSEGNKVSYDEAWNIILNMKPQSEKNVPGAFVDWDNSPRHKNRATIYTGVSPEKFEKYLTMQIKRAKEVYNKDYLFMYAWNEWAEGGYLEPDETTGYRNLEAIKNALEANGEFPNY